MSLAYCLVSGEEVKTGRHANNKGCTQGWEFQVSKSGFFECTCHWKNGQPSFLMPVTFCKLSDQTTGWALHGSILTSLKLILTAKVYSLHHSSASALPPSPFTAWPQLHDFKSIFTCETLEMRDTFDVSMYQGTCFIIFIHTHNRPQFDHSFFAAILMPASPRRVRMHNGDGEKWFQQQHTTTTLGQTLGANNYTSCCMSKSNHCDKVFKRDSFTRPSHATASFHHLAKCKNVPSKERARWHLDTVVSQCNQS